MSNSNTITLEHFVTLLDGIPKRDRGDFVQIAYNAIKPLIQKKVEEYKEIYKFFDALEKFSEETGEIYEVSLDEEVNSNSTELEQSDKVDNDDVKAETTDGEEVEPTTDAPTEKTETETVKEVEKNAETVKEEDTLTDAEKHDNENVIDDPNAVDVRITNLEDQVNTLDDKVDSIDGKVDTINGNMEKLIAFFNKKDNEQLAS